MKYTKSLLALIAAAALASEAAATLIPISAPPTNTVLLSGQGLGTVNTLLTVQSPGSSTNETGTVAWNGSSVVTTGDTQAINNVYTLSQLGTTNFSNLVLLFNGNEGGGPNQSITLNSLSLNVYSAAGALLDSFSTAGAVTYTAFPGTGNAGFAYRLDAQQLAEANALITSPASLTSLRLGASMSASNADAGIDTISIATLGAPTGVPDSGATVAMLGLALAALGAARRYLR